MTGLDEGRSPGIGSNGHAGNRGHEFFDIDRIDTAVAPLINHLEDVIRLHQGKGDLEAAGPPATGNRHFP